MTTLSPAATLRRKVRAQRRAQKRLSDYLDIATYHLGFQQKDFLDAGCSDYQAREYGRIEPDFTFDRGRLVSGDPTLQPDDDDVVALVASRKERAMHYIDTVGVYLRDRSLRQPVRHIAKFLGTDRNRTIETVRPIRARYLIASAADIPPAHPTDPTIDAELRRVLKRGDVQADWPNPCDVFVLGDPIRIDLPLGYMGGLLGTRHHTFGQLRTAAKLVGLPSA